MCLAIWVCDYNIMFKNRGALKKNISDIYPINRRTVFHAGFSRINLTIQVQINSFGKTYYSKN